MSVQLSVTESNEKASRENERKEARENLKTFIGC